MKKSLVRITLAALLMIFATGSVCWAKSYGPWTMALYRQFCTGGDIKKQGCKKYIHYRLDWNKTRNDAESECYESCSTYQQGLENVHKCFKGCQNARSQEN